MQAQYRYKAASQDGAVRQGTITAHSEEAAEEFLAGQGLIPLEVRSLEGRQALTLFGLLKGTDYEQLIMFTSQLATLHRAGVPLLRALSIIRIGKPGGRFNQVIDQIRLAVQSGKSLSEAMSDHTDVFSRVYTSSVAAGEESGKLEHTLDELSAMLEREMELGRQIKTATRYPLIVLGVIVLAIIVVMTFVIPRFIAFYDAFGAQLPLPTRILIGISRFMTHYWPILLGLAVVGGFGIRKILGTTGGRHWLDRQLLRLPIFGDLIVKSNVARFTLLFRMMFRAGLPIIRSLEILSTAIRNTAISAEIRRLEELFRRGRDLSGSEGEFRFFPDLALQLMSIGFESGSLDNMLQEIGSHYIKEVNYRARQLTAVIEPILTLVLGCFVLLLALAMFLPMWNLIKVFRG
ncbi:MAG: type II secretion system F family protein [Candidatus Zixiibacteriota bacterium]